MGKGGESSGKGLHRGEGVLGGKGGKGWGVTKGRCI